MAEIKMVSCCTCGYEWQQGRDGGHHCSTHMEKTIERQAAEIERLKAAQSMAPASAAHGEIALRWRVQADGLYAVDMMVSNLSTEAQAHAAMAYVQSLFAGDEMAGKH